MPLSRPLRGYRNLQRLSQIINVFAKHGFGYLAVQLRLKSILPLRRRFGGDGEGIQALTVPERIRLAMEELGPTFIKLGQMLSSRPDLVPASFVEEFKRLQDKVPPFPFAQVREILERELGSPLEKNFPQFSETPHAAASMAQVHSAVSLHGEPVIVKVQRPEIEKIIEEDIQLLAALAQLLEKYVAEVRIYNPTGIVSEFSRAIRRELDFTLESSNLERFRDHFKGERSIVIPRVFWNQSTSRVLTLERLEGIPIDEVAKIRAQGHSEKKIARLLVDAYLMQIFEHGLFHADPHPGNILVLPESKLGLLDFGIVGRIRPQMMEVNASIFLALVKRDYDRLVEEVLKVGLVTDESTIHGFREDLIDFIEPYYGRDLAQIEVGKIVSEAIHLANTYHIRLPLDLVLLGKTLATVEGVARQLDPHLNLLEIARPYARRLIRKERSPWELASKALSVTQEYKELTQELPSQIRLALKKLLHGKLRVEFSHVGLEHLPKEMDRSSNRIASSLIISAIIVASSLIINSGRGPLILGFSALGVIGFSLAGLLGLWLAIAILRSGRL
ncbi:MAG: AarF/ABC1/UbiB kinase family protein [candidate division NC10 bacterium]|nr:AarF/ABC1/UbiB kinase family protein [candidate division NC10 bacterium]